MALSWVTVSVDVDSSIGFVRPLMRHSGNRRPLRASDRREVSIVNSAAKVLVAVGLAAAAAGVGWYFLAERTPPPPPPAEAPKPPPGPAGPKYPVPESPASDKPLPKLGESDAERREALAPVIDLAAIDRFVNIEDFVRRVVATIDNLPREHYATRLNPLKPTPGTPRVTGRGDTLALDPANAKRYEPLVALMERVDTHALVGVYLRYYPLFQDAYRELGYPEGHFNDRLVEVIDHLLATPEVKGPIRLAAPHVLYEYADPDLEALSSGQKVLVRIGPDNAARVKDKLREIRQEIAGK